MEYILPQDIAPCDLVLSNRNLFAPHDVVRQCLQNTLGSQSWHPDWVYSSGASLQVSHYSVLYCVQN